MSHCPAADLLGRPLRKRPHCPEAGSHPLWTAEAEPAATACLSGGGFGVGFRGEGTASFIRIDLFWGGGGGGESMTYILKRQRHAINPSLSPPRTCLKPTNRNPPPHPSLLLMFVLPLRCHFLALITIAVVLGSYHPKSRLASKPAAGHCRSASRLVQGDPAWAFAGFGAL